MSDVIGSIDEALGSLLGVSVYYIASRYVTLGGSFLRLSPGSANRVMGLYCLPSQSCSQIHAIAVLFRYTIRSIHLLID